MQSSTVIIVGGGFAGIYSAWRLSRDGINVTLIEGSDHLGGTLWSIEWNGYLVDSGTHTLDLRTPMSAEFFSDVLGNELKETNQQNFGSTIGQAITPGFEMPDFSSDEPAFCEIVLEELAQINFEQVQVESSGYDAWLLANYGSTLGARLKDMTKKVTGSTSELLSVPASASLGMLSRPKLGSDAEMISLKESAEFYNSRLGVSLESGDERFAGLNVNKRYGYPATGALRRFCIKAQARLEELGVNIITKSKVIKLTQDKNFIEVTLKGTGPKCLSAPRLFWSLSDHGLMPLLGVDMDLTTTALPVGCAFFAFEVPVDCITTDLQYLNDFSDLRPTYRYNQAGVYSGQIKHNGYTFVTAEVPSHPAKLNGILTPEFSKIVWQSFLDVGFIKPDTSMGAFTYWGYPVAYTLPKIGWEAPMNAMRSAITSWSPRLFTVEFGHRGRNAFMQYYETTLQKKLKF